MTVQSTSAHFAHETDARRYTMRVGNDLVAVVDYAINGDAISFTRTFTSPPHRGNGYAAELVKFAVDDVESTSSRHIIPMCWYVSDWFELHGDRKTLLAPRA